MKGTITDKARVLHILDAINEIADYLNGVSYDGFINNSEKRFATIKQIEIIGEARNQLSDAFKNLHPEIEWKSIRGFRIFPSTNTLELTFKSFGK